MDLKRARDLLLSEQSELTELYERISESSGLDVSVEEATGELTGVDQHLGDHATEMFEREKDQSIGQGLTRKLEEIDAALARIDGGEYGVCQVCGREIPDERLEAVPATRFCRDHADTGIPDKGPDVEITQEIDET